MSQPNLSRRSFLKGAAATGVGLVVGIPNIQAKAADSQKPVGGFIPNAFIQILPDSSVHFQVPSSEIGQGVYHGQTTLVAEELELLPEQITPHHAYVDDAFKNPWLGMQGTGGSSSMSRFFYPVRQAAANAREVLRQAAAQQLGAPAGELVFSEGNIHYQNKAYPYGEFVELAATLPPVEGQLKPRSEFKILGKKGRRIDSLSKSTGTAMFGLDAEIPGMHYLTVIRSPVYGGKVVSFDKTAAEAASGVTHVLEIPAGIAVVAKSYWQARKAAKLVKVEWDNPELANYSSDNLRDILSEKLNEKEGREFLVTGEGKKALENASTKKVEAEYWVPYLAHATMEPMTCVANFSKDKGELWVGSQSPKVMRGAAAFVSGVDEENILIHSVFSGGGFGRRYMADAVTEAVTTSQAVGLPIKLIWSREDDIKHDFYRAPSLVQLKAGLNEDGTIDAWYAKRSGPDTAPYVFDDLIDAVGPSFLPKFVRQGLSKMPYLKFKYWAVDDAAIEGLYEDYDATHKEMGNVYFDPGLRTGYWRSVGHSMSGFCKESFVDELALAAGKDPVEFRLANTKNNPRVHGVIKEVAEKAGWGKPLPEGHFHGVAAHFSFFTAVAQVAEVSVTNGQIKVHKVTCAVDCGFAVNPNIVVAQMESAIIYGLTAALHGEITLKDGVVEQSNFHDYPMLRMNEVPAIDVHIVDSDEDPTGVGEPGTPPLAGAVANAVYAATGKRLRSLPLRL